MKRTIVTIMLIWSCLDMSAQTKISGFKPEIEPYISFIKKQHADPLSYLLDKYKTHDVIVFGERDHRDITQYYFLEKLFNTEEFYKQVNELYSGEEMKKAGVDILALVEKDLEAVKELPTEKAITTLCEKWQEPKNEVRNRLLLMATRCPDTIGVIEANIK